ncbi:MAG: amidophosphoribosyltransferase [Clostridia bacterium]|nr:amidophosphoribosyltransferase [Clostridia bacterium]
MGGFFGAVCSEDAVTDVFFGVDYHSHLGTRRGGMACVNDEIGFQRYIHSIENSPFRTKFEDDITKMQGRSCIGCISDSDPQPILIRSNLGVYAIAVVGVVSNADALIKQYLAFSGGHFTAMTSGKINTIELVSALINQKSSFEEGIRFAHDMIEGTASILVLCEDGSLIAARDKYGRLPLIIGKKHPTEDNPTYGHCATFEDFAMRKLDYVFERELGPGEIVRITADEITQLAPPRKEKRICAFLWTYYGYPNAVYEGINVEAMRMKNGQIMARADKADGVAQDIDYVAGMPDSGVPHAIGYANESHIPYARPFVKYTPTWPRSFMPTNQSMRNKIAKMKQIPVHALIEDKKLLFVDDSIVRGTQIRETVDFLYDNGAKEVHIRSACPPIMFGCKFLNFSRSNSDMELIARKTIQELEGDEGHKYIAEYSDASTERGKKLRAAMAQKFKLTSLQFQSVEGVIEAIGLPADQICTYCWTGKD